MIGLHCLRVGLCALAAHQLDLKIVLASCEGSESDRDTHISQRRPVPTRRLCGWSYSANAADTRSAQTTRIGGLLAGASYDMHHARWHTISTGPQHRRLSDRGDA